MLTWCWILSKPYDLQKMKITTYYMVVYGPNYMFSHIAYKPCIVRYLLLKQVLIQDIASMIIQMYEYIYLDFTTIDLTKLEYRLDASEQGNTSRAYYDGEPMFCKSPIFNSYTTCIPHHSYINFSLENQHQHFELFLKKLCANAQILTHNHHHYELFTEPALKTDIHQKLWLNIEEEFDVHRPSCHTITTLCHPPDLFKKSRSYITHNTQIQFIMHPTIRHCCVSGLHIDFLLDIMYVV
jgi:hypothetical protein